MPKLGSTSSAFSHIGPNVWNQLPYNVRCLSDIVDFKRMLKSHYFNIAFKDI